MDSKLHVLEENDLRYNKNSNIHGCASGLNYSQAKPNIAKKLFSVDVRLPIEAASFISCYAESKLPDIISNLWIA